MEPMHVNDSEVYGETHLRAQQFLCTECAPYYTSCEMKVTNSYHYFFPPIFCEEGTYNKIPRT